MTMQIFSVLLDKVRTKTQVSHEISSPLQDAFTSGHMNMMAATFYYMDKVAGCCNFGTLWRLELLPRTCAVRMWREKLTVRS